MPQPMGMRKPDKLYERTPLGDMLADAREGRLNVVGTNLPLTGASIESVGSETIASYPPGYVPGDASTIKQTD